MSILTGTSPSANVNSQSLLTPEQEALFIEQFLPGLESLTPTTPSISSQLEQLSLAALEERAMSAASGESRPNSESISSLLQQLGASSGESSQQALLSALSGGNIQGIPEQIRHLAAPLKVDVPTGNDFEEFFQKTVQQPLIKQFEEDILPRISRRYAPSGFVGSERQKSEERSRGDLIQALAQQRASLAFKGREADIGRQHEAAMAEQQDTADIIKQMMGQDIQRGQLAQQALQTSIGGLTQASSLENDTANSELQELLGLFSAGQAQSSLETQNANIIRQDQLQRLQLILQALGTPMQENIATVTPGQAGIGQGLASGVGAAIMLSMLSDENAKTNIEDLDLEECFEAVVNMPLKSWKYLKNLGISDNIHIGPMAQEAPEMIKIPGEEMLNIHDELMMIAGAIQHMNNEGMI